MGYFSWTCARTRLPILAAGPAMALGEMGRTLSNVTLVGQDGAVAAGVYDGYGRISGLDLIETDWARKIDAGKAALVLSAWYDEEPLARIGGRSRHDPGQGFFHDTEDLVKMLAAAPLPVPREREDPDGGVNLCEISPT